MPDFRQEPEDGSPSETESRKDRDVRERVAAYRAMPLRSIVALERGGRVGVLDCGHRQALLVWLRVGEHMRCRECFLEGMLRAEKMLEQWTP